MMSDPVDVAGALGLTPELVAELAKAWDPEVLPPNSAGAILSTLQAYSKKGLVVREQTTPEGQRVTVQAFEQCGVCSECGVETSRFYWYDLGDGQVTSPVCSVCYAHTKGRKYQGYSRVVVYELELTPAVFSAMAVWYCFHAEAIRGEPLLTQSTSTLITQMGEDDYLGLF